MVICRVGYKEGGRCSGSTVYLCPSLIEHAPTPIAMLNIFILTPFFGGGGVNMDPKQFCHQDPILIINNILHFYSK